MATDKRMLCDLHTHSTFSDGTWEPEAIVSEAERIGLSAVALTDHNTITGLPRFLEAAKGRRIEAVAGVEISTDYGETELHIVGLLLPKGVLGEIDSMLVRLRERKEESNREMVARLTSAGYCLDYERIRASSSGLFNRAHIASALLDGGYVGSVAEAFERILSKDSPYYVPTRRLPVLEVIGRLRELGAVPVLAHPLLNLSEDELRAFLPSAMRAGLVAMETVYSTYSEAEARLAGDIACELSVAESGGSDFHGERKPDIAIGYGRGGLAVPSEFYEKLREFAK